MFQSGPRLQNQHLPLPQPQLCLAASNKPTAPMTHTSEYLDTLKEYIFPSQWQTSRPRLKPDNAFMPTHPTREEMSSINIDLPIALLYHHSKALERISIRLGTGSFSRMPLSLTLIIINQIMTPFVAPPSRPPQDLKPCPACLVLPRQDLCTICRRSWLQNIEHPIAYQRVQHFFLAVVYLTCGWVNVIGNMVNNWWNTSTFISKARSNLAHNWL